MSTVGIGAMTVWIKMLAQSIVGDSREQAIAREQAGSDAKDITYVQARGKDIKAGDISPGAAAMYIIHSLVTSNKD